MAEERQPPSPLPAPEDNVKPLDYKEQFQVSNFPAPAAVPRFLMYLVSRVVM